MKKLLLTLVAIVAAMSMSAQVLTVMKDGKVIKAYSATEANEFYFGEIAQRDYVDLGLSVKWATMNVGATKPEEAGLYFAWGDTQGYGSNTSDGHLFNWANCKYSNSDGTAFSKYNTTDGKTVLESDDDAAVANWGGAWRMPTMAEFSELIDTDNCTWQEATMNGVKGCKIISKIPGYEGRWIFMPALGFRSGSSIGRNGTDSKEPIGYYWSANRNDSAQKQALGIDFHSTVQVNEVRNYVGDRSMGFTVRAVMDKY